MEVNSQTLERHLKKASLISNVVSISIATITAIGIGAGFYYSTQSTLERHEEDLQQIKIDVNETKKHLNDIEVYRGVSATEIKNIDKKVDAIDVKLDRILTLAQKNVK